MDDFQNSYSSTCEISFLYLFHNIVLLMYIASLLAKSVGALQVTQLYKIT